MQTTLNYVEINPPKKEIATIIWLHGLGADGNDFVPIVPELNLPDDFPIRFIFPHAPMRSVTINNGHVMRAWFDISNLTNKPKIDHQGILESVQQVEDLILQEEKRGITSDKIILAGFSQGATIALTTGLCSKKPIGGILALSGFLPEPEKVLAIAPAINYSIPIFIAHGTEDTVLPSFLGEQTYTILQKNKYLVSWHPYPMAHTVCREELGDIATWLQKILRFNHV